MTARPGDAGKKKTPVTTVTVELLTGTAGQGLKARQWAEILSKLDVVVTVRNGRSDDKVGITERKAGPTLRSIVVVGELDNSGKLFFPGQVFTEDDAGKLADWINELRVYGAQGDPNGRPVWGLTKEQFGVIHAALKRPLAADTREVEITKAVGLLELPKDHPVRFSTEAVARLKEHGGQVRVSQSLQGISQGTALAVLLAEQGMGFRPAPPSRRRDRADGLSAGGKGQVLAGGLAARKQCARHVSRAIPVQNSRARRRTARRGARGGRGCHQSSDSD